MRVCILGNVPLSRLKAAFIRNGHAAYAFGDVRQWMREVEDRTSVIHELAPDAFCIVFDVGYSELSMMSREARNASVAKVFMASVVVGIRNGKATVSDLLLNGRDINIPHLQTYCKWV